MHIGAKPQQLLVKDGYNQEVEDQLFTTIDWKKIPNLLFDISSVALSSKDGYFSEFAESNAFCMYKKDFLSLGGFEKRFQSRGGGLVNLDFFNRVHQDVKYEPVLLLGEATFHQFHGGVATNVPVDELDWDNMAREYEMIRGCPFDSKYSPPFYFGKMNRESSRFSKINY